jgi:hypothetical protein
VSTGVPDGDDVLCFPQKEHLRTTRSRYHGSLLVVHSTNCSVFCLRSRNSKIQNPFLSVKLGTRINSGPAREWKFPSTLKTCPPSFRHISSHLVLFLDFTSSNEVLDTTFDVFLFVIVRVISSSSAKPKGIASHRIVNVNGI